MRHILFFIFYLFVVSILILCIHGYAIFFCGNIIDNKNIAVVFNILFY